MLTGFASSLTRTGHPGSVAARRGRSRTRRPTSRVWVIEPLEGRVVPATIPVTTLADAGPGSLRAAVEQANLDPAQDLITFDPSVRGTITLDTALPDLTTAVDIEGPGANALTVARSGTSGTLPFRLFTVSTGAVATIAGLTVTGGDDIFQGGGGVDNSGTLTLRGIVVTGNVSEAYGDSHGGGIANTGMMTITGSTISDNTAKGLQGFGFGGAGDGGGISNSGTLAVADSTISNNSAGGGGQGSFGAGVAAFSGRGGGIQNSGSLTLTNVKIRDNTASGGGGDGPGGSGGGIDNFGTVSLAYVTLENNSASSSSGFVTSGTPGLGGGIATSGRVTSSSSTFTNPVGGNVFVSPGGAFVSRGRNVFSDVPPIVLDPTDVVPFTPPPVAPVPPTVTSVSRTGVHRQPTALVLTFSAALDPARARDVHNYTVVRVGPRGRSRPREAPVPVASVAYRAQTDTVIVSFRRRLNLHGYYRLTVKGGGPGGLASSAGVPLDGAGNGRPGTAYTTVVHGFGPDAV